MPAVPITMIGVGRCFIRSQTLAQLQSAAAYCSEYRPPMETSQQEKKKNISTSASRKLGVASPTNPRVVSAKSVSEY